MKIVEKSIAIFGAGKIGRSFIGQLFSRSRYQVIFIDVDLRIINELNQRKKCDVVIRSENDKVLEITNVCGISVNDLEKVVDVIALLKGRLERLVKIVADGGYRGELIEKTKTVFGWILEIVLRPDHSSKFVVIPQRWVVERTFAWFESYRRLSKDFEYLIDTNEAIIQFAMIKLMLNRIQK